MQINDAISYLLHNPYTSLANKRARYALQLLIANVSVASPLTIHRQPHPVLNAYEQAWLAAQRGAGPGDATYEMLIRLPIALDSDYTRAMAIAAGVLGGGETMLSYLQSLANQGYIAEMWLADEPSVQPQSGSTLIGQVNGLNATLTNTSWVAGGGLDFDGTTSIAQVTNHATLANLTTQASAFLVKEDGTGESDIGTTLAWGLSSAGTHFVRNQSSNRYRAAKGAATSDAIYISVTNSEVASRGTKQWKFIDYDDADVLGNGRVHRFHRGMNGAVNNIAAGLNGPAVGTLTNQTADLFIGNQQTAAQTLDGIIYKLIVFNAAALPILVSDIYPKLVQLAGV